LNSKRGCCEWWWSSNIRTKIEV